jgi:hypothetical protein
MSTELIRCTGIEHEHRHPCALGQRSVAFVELITTAALALSTAVAATAVSIGIARADAVHVAASGQGTSFAIALVMGLLLCGLAALRGAMAVRAQSN